MLDSFDIWSLCWICTNFGFYFWDAEYFKLLSSLDVMFLETQPKMRTVQINQSIYLQIVKKPFCFYCSDIVLFTDFTSFSVTNSVCIDTSYLPIQKRGYKVSFPICYLPSLFVHKLKSFNYIFKLGKRLQGLPRM